MEKAKNRTGNLMKSPSRTHMVAPASLLLENALIQTKPKLASGSLRSNDYLAAATSRPMASQLSSSSIGQYADFLRTVSRERRTLGEVLADAKFFAKAWREHSAGLDAEARLGLARSHDLLVLLAAAMKPATRSELEAKHEALAGVQGLDPATAGLNLVVNAALSADWTRFESAERREALIGLDPIAH